MVSQKLSSRLKTTKNPTAAANRFVDLFHHVIGPSEEQRALVAAAHYTLATANDISHTRAKMHTNSAITILKSIKNRKKEWDSQIAEAYYKRAELFEKDCSFIAALQDYQHAINVFNKHDDFHCVEDKDKLLIAQCSISISDLLLHEQIKFENKKFSHPLFYVNQALECLSSIDDFSEDTWVTLAYGHQIAGIALSTINFQNAIQAFRTSLEVTFEADPMIASPILSEVYSCLGLLHEQHFQECPIQKKASFELIDNAMVYFGMALLFNPVNFKSSDNLSLQSLFDLIHRALDPYLPPISSPVMHNFIDGLLFAYYCLIDHKLPNQYISEELSLPQNLNSFAQHIFWLVSETFHREYPNARLLDIADPKNVDLSLDTNDLIRSLMNPIPQNVHYLT